MKRCAGCIALLLSFLLSGCGGGWQSALDPKGPGASELAWLIWSFTGLLGAIWLAVLAAVGLTVLRRRADTLLPPPTSAPREQRSVVIVTALAVLTVLVVLVLTGLSFVVQRRLYAASEGAVTIRAVGYQWWWEFNYGTDGTPESFTTANEIHVPLGVPVRIALESDDVIHSFWVPNLIGKQDLIPSQTNELTFTATQAGIYRGQCAEFCGLQHAHMGLIVVVEDEAAFQAWQEQQRRPAQVPAEPERQKGQEVFLQQACIMCHTIRGTPAISREGPDLTHIGSRLQLAAATLPLTRGSLAAWIADPHGIKPGVHMPAVPLEPDQLNALAAYLEGLR
ncbi:MAG TPA: cytochrome c oxidase subunit II [Geminicoccus sp.]|uniref:cytochrome c oxidase subunit II n=1 Tax=Geminicoccus sp. TaxID=2024832 RepID=UPI002E380E1A|nr:cytochrome c oxidase subunit II [Geminicoccus sp.]HEX2528915.1 cytochrome c oxidase subunit II [Geminicoccus sp.]